MDVDFSSLAIFILVLLSIVAVLAVLGNGFVLGIVTRFKTFRTFPNILIANLALIDFFQRAHQYTYLPALGCPEGKMVYRKGCGNYFTASVTHLYHSQHRLHGAAARKCVSSDRTGPKILHMEDEWKSSENSRCRMGGLCHRNCFVVVVWFWYRPPRCLCSQISSFHVK